jgi:structural toxin protein (hemagglutinin/hemolysin) RtxA
MYKIVFFVPPAFTEEVKLALFEAGAGGFRNYDFCSWQTTGTGQFRPLSESDPFIGEFGQVERVREDRVEMICSDEHVRRAVEALIAAHPYEEPAYEVFPILRLPDL